jgi:hypothetical protein
VYIHPTIFPMGVRIAEFMSEGYEPIGFFQMWHPGTSSVTLYPETHGAADRTDVLHAKKWPRKYRALIPEVIAIHLDSEDLDLKKMGKNWNGRKTKMFGYSPVPPEKPSRKIPWATIGWSLLAVAAGSGVAAALMTYPITL